MHGGGRRCVDVGMVVVVVVGVEVDLSMSLVK